MVPSVLAPIRASGSVLGKADTLLTLGAHAQRGLLYLGLCICVSVKSHFTYGASVRPENAVTYSAGNKGQKIFGDLLETTALKSYAAKHERKSQYANCSDLPAVGFSACHTAKRQKVPNDCQQHSVLPKTMPTDGASPLLERELHALQLQREAWPISAHAHWHSTQDMLYLRRRFCTSVLFIDNRWASCRGDWKRSRELRVNRAGIH